jgi:hypothetical protein
MDAPDGVREELSKLRLEIPDVEIHGAYDDHAAARREPDPRRAYELYRRALVGDGNGECSRGLSNLVDVSIGGFMASEELASRRIFRLLGEEFGRRVRFDLIRELSLVHCCADLQVSSGRLSSLCSSEGRSEEAIRWQKECIFWQVCEDRAEIYEPDNSLNEEIWKLEKLLGESLNVLPHREN